MKNINHFSSFQTHFADVLRKEEDQPKPRPVVKKCDEVCYEPFDMPDEVLIKLRAKYKPKNEEATISF